MKIELTTAQTSRLLAVIEDWLLELKHEGDDEVVREAMQAQDVLRDTLDRRIRNGDFYAWARRAIGRRYIGEEQ